MKHVILVVLLLAGVAFAGVSGIGAGPVTNGPYDDYELVCPINNGTAHTGGTAFLCTLHLARGQAPAPHADLCAAHQAQAASLGGLVSDLATAKALRIAQIQAADAAAVAAGFSYSLTSAPANPLQWSGALEARWLMTTARVMEVDGTATFPYPIPSYMLLSGSGTLRSGDCRGLLLAAATWRNLILLRTDALVSQVNACATIADVIAVPTR